jgi:hypothetical protein
MLIQRLLTLAFVLGSVLPAAKADTMTFSSSSSFLAQLGSQFTDNYSNPGYFISGDPAQLSDKDMSAVIGETTYHSTGFSDTNIVSSGSPSGIYCAGCNGSFELGFTSTSVGSSNGVFGVGFDVVFASPGEYAFVTFGDGSTTTIRNYLLTSGTYFGITSTLGIKAIDVGLINGGITPDPTNPNDPGNFGEIANLTIGAPVPEPTGWLLLATVVGLVTLLRRNRALALK